LEPIQVTRLDTKSAEAKKRAIESADALLREYDKIKY